MRNFLKTDHTTTDDETQPDENGDKAMSLDTTVPNSDERHVLTGLVDENEPAAEPIADQDRDIDDDRPKPTFTPASTASTASTNGGPATTAGSGAGTDPADDDGNFTRAMPAVTSAADEHVTDLPADEPVVASNGSAPRAMPAAPATPAAPVAPVAPATGDEPLLANTELMRASWQQVQAGFVDDPKAAVSDAADLIDVAVQALVETLRQRQRQLRDMSGSGIANGVSNSAGYGSAASSDVPDTEQLRLLMQRYRSLFNQLCRS